MPNAASGALEALRFFSSVEKNAAAFPPMCPRGVYIFVIATVSHSNPTMEQGLFYVVGHFLVTQNFTFFHSLGRFQGTALPLIFGIVLSYFSISMQQ